jgi:hypothetical protein
MENTNNIPTAYEGKEPYIFVSYAHKDSARVFPYILKMQQAGLRIWFDKGVEAGTEWPENIENHLVNADRVVVFMSEAAVSSLNCRNEVNLALSEKKRLLALYLENVELRFGMKLQLSSVQSVYLYQGVHEQEIYDMPFLSACRTSNAPTLPQENTTLQINRGEGDVIASLKRKIKESHGEELIFPSLKKMRTSTTFTLAPNGDGVCVPQLKGFVLKWAHFQKIVEKANRLGGIMYREDAAAMNGGKLGKEISFDSMEGFIASDLLGATEGSSVTRRSTYYSGILAWAGIVSLHKSEGAGSYITVNKDFRHI